MLIVTTIIMFLLIKLFALCSSTTAMATGANTTPMGPLHPILAAKIRYYKSSLWCSTYVQMSSLLVHTYSAAVPSHPAPSETGNGVVGGSKDPELRRHLEAAKRAASALFPSGWFSERERGIVA